MVSVLQVSLLTTNIAEVRRKSSRAAISWLVALILPMSFDNIEYGDSQGAKLKDGARAASRLRDHGSLSVA